MRMHLVLAVFSLAIHLSPLPLPAQSGAETLDAPVVRGDAGRRMAELMRRAEVFGFAGQVLTARGGEVLLHGAWGFADRGSGRRFTVRTPVGIASGSKTFAAAAAMRLAEEGRLSLDDTLGGVLPDVPADKRGITLAQLLSHQGGIGGGFTGDYGERTLQAQIARVLAAPLRAAPGEKWIYSSEGYAVAAAWVQAAAGEPYGAYLRRALFAPAGMRSTGEAGPASPPGAARHYVGWRDRGSPNEGPYNPRGAGAGDLVSTAADLYRWYLAEEAASVLSRASIQAMRTPHASVGEGVAYGLGLFIHRRDSAVFAVEHGGDDLLGSGSAFFRYPGHGAVLIITSNTRDAFGRWMRQGVQARLEGALTADDSMELPPPARLLTRAEGARLVATYEVPGGGRLHVVEHGTHWLAAEGQPAIDLLAGGPVSGAAAANARTARLFAALARGDGHPAFAAALGTDAGPESLDALTAWWDGVIRREGPLLGCEVLGTTAADALRGSSLRTAADSARVLTYVRLRFPSGARVMRLRWGGRGSGPLAQVDPDATMEYPLVFGFGAAGDGEYVAHDLFTRATVRLRESARGLVLVGRAATVSRRVGMGGWTPGR
jgi:CubicO group peptidase (beta-lactamase class C family)